MHRRLVAIVLVGLFALGGACKNDPKEAKDAPATTTTTAAPASTTTTAVPNGPVTSADAAANGLFDAWRAGDRDAASRYARQHAIQALFAHPNTGDVEYQSQGCEPQGGQFICSWTYPGGALQMTVEGVLGNDGFVVDNVTYIAD